MKKLFLVLSVCAVILDAQAQSFIVSIEPSGNAQQISPSANISIVFGVDINPATLTQSTVKVFGSISGAHAPTSIVYDGTTRSVEIDPAADFTTGETATVVVTTGVKTMSGTGMPVSFVSQFSIAARGGSGVLANTGYYGTGNQPWTAAAADFNHDGISDFLVLNRLSQSVSLLRNYGSGNFLLVASNVVGKSASSFVVADINGDGTPDCAVANEGSNTMTLLFMDARGIVTRTVTTAVPGAPSAITATDVNGDGATDLIVAGRTSNSVYIYKNDGSGAFTLFSTIDVGAGPTALVVADFTNDNTLDIAVASETANTVTILMNDGAGVLTASNALSVPASPVSLAAGDVDNDGVMDIVVACKISNKISVLHNDGLGILSSTTVLTSVTSPLTVVTGDMDGDGKCDIVGQGTDIVVFLNQGAFQFSMLPPATGGTSYRGLVLADFDGDGDLDCASPNNVSGGLSLFTNKPPVAVSVSPTLLDFGSDRWGVTIRLPLTIRNDGFTVPLKILSISSSNPSIFSCDTPEQIAPLDSTTIIVTCTPSEAKKYSDSLTLTTNDPMKPMVNVYLKVEGRLVILSTLPVSGGTVTDGMSSVAATFNGDVDGASLRKSTMKLYGEMSGLHAAQIVLDKVARKAIVTPIKKFITGEQVTTVVTDSVTAGTFRLLDGYVFNYSVLPTRGSELYSLGGSFPTGTRPSGVASGDFNGDGYTDIAVVNNADNSVSIYMNDTHGGLAPQVVYGLGTSGQGLCVADVNEDGASDILAVNPSTNTVSILLNKNIADGTFLPTLLSFKIGVSAQAVAIGDIDNDGHLDMVTANTKDNTISLCTNDGSAHFTLSNTIQVGTSPVAVAIADINNDGATDIIVLNGGGSTVTVLTNMRGLYTASTHATGSAPVAMAVKDVTGDGYCDIAIANGGSKNITVLINDRNGGFTAASSVPLYNEPTALYVGDMSGDGRKDIVVTQYSAASATNSVLMLTNTGSGSFVRGDSVGMGSPVAVTGFDLYNHNILHLAVTNLLSATLSVINPAGGPTPVLISPLPSTTLLKQPITMVWKSTGLSTMYHIQVADSATGTLVVDDSTVVQSQYDVSGLAYSTNYKWRTCAKNDIGWGMYSSWWNYTTCMAAPRTPLLIAPARAATEQEAAPQFLWQAVATAASYKIQISEDSLFTTLAAAGAPNDTVWQSPALKIHVSYFWRVKALNAGGESEWSAVQSFKTLLPIPEKVQLGAPSKNSILGASTVKFSWKATQWEVTRYWIEFAADSLFMFRITDSMIVDTLWQISNVSSNQKYYWKVRAYNAKGWGPFSDISSFTLNVTSVSNNGTLPDHFALEQNFPNPFNPSTHIQFSIAAACPVQLKIYDILGREVADLVNDRLMPGIYTVQWNAHNIPSGIYLYRLNAGTFVQIKKLALQK